MYYRATRLTPKGPSSPQFMVRKPKKGRLSFLTMNFRLLGFSDLWKKVAMKNSPLNGGWCKTLD